MGTLWPHSCCSIPLSALLGHSGPEACSSDVSSCCCLHLYLLFLWACCQILLQQVVLSLVLQLGMSCSPCLEPSGVRAALSCVPVAAKERCSTSLAAVEVGREPSPVLPGKLMAALLPHPFPCVLPEVH